MFCPKCSQKNDDDAKFCVGCGNGLGSDILSKSTASSANVAAESMTFPTAISTCFSKYFDFKGRASRPEYWWFYLFVVLLSWGAMIVDRSTTLSGLINFAVFIPVIAAGTRRLHDTGRSGWWQLLSLTVIGAIPVIIWLSSKGSSQENIYGKPV